MNQNTKRYLELFESWHGNIESFLKECESKGELKSKKEMIIIELKKENYPKSCEKEIIKYIQSINL